MAGSGTACPSGRCREGAHLIGIVRPDGTIAYLGGPLEVDDAFVEIAQKGRSPETRFRFTEPCARDQCGHWSQGQCGLVEELAEFAPLEEDRALPSCGIRATCVWFSQRGKSACKVCPRVVRTLTPAPD